jgi:hypothetical protein
LLRKDFFITAGGPLSADRILTGDVFPEGNNLMVTVKGPEMQVRKDKKMSCGMGKK